MEQHDHRDGTYKKEAWVTVAFWDEGLSLIGFVTDFVRTVRVIFQATDSLALVVLYSLRHAPRRHCLKQIKSNKNGYGILGRFSYCSTKRIEVLSNEIARSHPLRCTPSLLYLESNCECMCHLDHRRRFPIKIIGRVVRILMLQEAVKTSTLHSAKFESDNPRFFYVELFELCETIPKEQCSHCLHYWNQGIVYGTCGHCLIYSE